MSLSANWTRENIAWAAGLFEGEGCITGRKQTAQLQLNMTDEDVVRQFHRLIGVGTVCGPYRNKRLPHAKPCWRWVCGGAMHVQAVLAALWPFLMSRRQAKAREVIVALSSMQPHPKHRKACPKGHPYDEANTRKSVYGRTCRTCGREATRAYREKQAERCLSAPTPN